jgi:hypothetical protein
VLSLKHPSAAKESSICRQGNWYQEFVKCLAI